MTVSTKRLLGLTLLALTSSGCATNRGDILHFLREHEHQVSAIEYRVGIPDSIIINAPKIIELDSVSERIQPDGKVNLLLLGEVKIVGMTAKEIAAKLRVLLSRYYVDPKLSVSVTYRSKIYYIHDQAGRLAVRPYTGRDTLLDAVVSAGVDFRSQTSHVKVIRPSRGEVPVREIVVNVDDMIKEGDWSRNVLLEPDDMVMIPPTPFSWMAQRIREILYPVGPAVQAYTVPASLIQLDDVYSGNANGINGFNGRFGGGLNNLGGIR